MMKTLLIHGYATKLQASVFRKPLPDHEGFAALKDEIARGEIGVFHWGINRSLSFIQSLNPLLKPINLHTSPLRDQEFTKRLLDE